MECGVLRLDLTEGIGSFEELTVQVQTHSGTVVVFRFDLQATIAFFADLFFTSVTEAGGELHGPDKAAVLLFPEVVVRHFEIEGEVTEDADILHVDGSTDHRIAFLGEAGTHAKVRREVVGQGEALFEVHAVTTFGGFMHHVNDGKFNLGFQSAVEAAVEEADVQVGRNLVSFVFGEEDELHAVFFGRGAHSRLQSVLQSNTDQEVAVLGRSKRIPAHTHVSTESQLLDFVELVDVEHGDVDAQCEELH